MGKIDGKVCVVTGGASATWGSDAIAGVVNFITDKKFEGFKANMQGGISTYGDAANGLFQMAGGLKASMHYCGCASIADMQNKAEFVEITTAGMRESHVHDVQITKEAPNYRSE